MKKTKTKIMSLMVLGASLLFSSQDANAQFWNLIGNVGTSETANFVGSGAGDTMGLSFRTFNTTRMRIVGNRAADIAAGRVGFIGMGTLTPTSKLHVVGSILSTDNVVAQDTLRGLHMQMTSGAAAGRVLTSDATGNGIWSLPAAPVESDPQVGVNASNRVPRWSGVFPAGSLITGTIFDNGVNIGIGNVAPVAKLHVTGTTQLSGNTTVTGNATISGLTTTATFRMAGGAPGLNKILRSDATGNATWVAASTLFTETDPQVSSITTSRVPRWNGATLVDGAMFDNGVNVGLGTTAPTQKLHVVGSILATGSIDVSGHVGFGSVEEFTDGGTNTIASNSSFVPTTDNVRDLGTSLLRWNDIFAGGNITGANIDVTGHVGFGSVEEFTDGGAFTIASNSNFVPLSDNGRDLGTSALRWNDVFTGGDVHVPGNLRNNTTTGAQIIKISTTAGSDCGIQFNRPGTGFFDFRMVNIGGNLRWQGSSDEFTTVTNEFMNLNLSTGSLGIGTSPGTAKLSVCGTVRCTELRVETGWCDYVFAKDYKLRPLEEVAAFIAENHHLPEINPGSDVETNGLNVGEMSAKMIKKIEELTLYVIQQNERLNALEKENAMLKNSK